MSANRPNYVSAHGYSSDAVITHPANQTPYGALDVVGGAFELTYVGPPNGYTKVISSSLRLDITGIPAGMTTFRAHLYNVTPPSALADNAPWDLAAGDRASYLGYLDLGTPVDVGATCTVQTDGLARLMKLAGTSVFAYLVTTGGYTPAANSEVYNLRLCAVSL